MQVFFKTYTKGDVKVMVDQKWEDLCMVVKPLCCMEWLHCRLMLSLGHLEKDK